MIRHALITCLGWAAYVFLILFMGCLPALYLLRGLKNGNPEWHKWYPSWALWLMGR